MMSMEEERELIVAWRERGDQRALKQLVDNQKRLMLSQSRRYVNARLSPEDLLQQGAIGIMRAAEKFDLDSDFRFVTYARWFTLDEISREGRSNSTSTVVPQSHMTGKGREIWEAWVAEQALCATTKTKMDGSEAAITARVAERLKVTPDRVVGVITAWRMTEHQIDAPMKGEDGDREAALPDVMKDKATGEDKIILDQAERGADSLIADLLSVLDDRERDIIHRRRFKNETLEEVSVIYEISRERVRQLESRAMKKMIAAGASRTSEAASYLDSLTA